jgi:hypothetical protein
MNRLKPILLLAAVVAAGCSSSDYDQKAPVASLSPPAALQTDFSNFVVTQLSQANTTETTVPVAVESTSFAFADDNNSTVFNSVLASAP